MTTSNYLFSYFLLVFIHVMVVFMFPLAYSRRTVVRSILSHANSEYLSLLIIVNTQYTYVVSKTSC